MDKTSDPAIGVFHQALFPRVVRVCKIDLGVQASFKLWPATECDIVVCGEALQINTMEQALKRDTNRVAFSVWQFNHPSFLLVSIHGHHEHPGTLFGDNEV